VIAGTAAALAVVAFLAVLRTYAAFLAGTSRMASPPRPGTGLTLRLRGAVPPARCPPRSQSWSPRAGAERAGPASRHAAGQRAVRRQETAEAAEAADRLAREGYWQGIVIGAAQILALLAGISRDGVVMAAGMFRGLTRSFLLSAPVILAAGVYKVPDLLGPQGTGILGQTLFATVLAGVGGYLSVGFLVRRTASRQSPQHP
jgi:hypothetical protein